MDIRNTDDLHGREGDDGPTENSPKATKAETHEVKNAVATTLVKFRHGHITQTYVSWLNNPEIVKYSEQRHVRHHILSCSEYLYEMRRHKLWAIMRDVHVGNISAHLDRNNGVADISILLGYSGIGIGTEALALACEELKDYRKLTLGCMASNKAMIRIAEKNGFKPDSFRPDYFMLDGKPEALVMMTR